MQQAGRCSDHTAFFYLGRLIEFGETSKDFFQSQHNDKPRNILPVDSVDEENAMIAPKHILGTFDEALASLRNNVLMMASLTERSLDRAINGLIAARR